jgi:hypothetical protein
MKTLAKIHQVAARVPLKLESLLLCLACSQNFLSLTG